MAGVIGLVKVNGHDAGPLLDGQVEPLEDLLDAVRVRHIAVVGVPVGRLSHRVLHVGARPEVGGALLILRGSKSVSTLSKKKQKNLGDEALALVLSR